MVKLHYFDQEKPDDDDFLLRGFVMDGKVPPTCLLGGMVIMDEYKKGKDPCAGCNCDRIKCNGRQKRDQEWWMTA